MDIKNALYLFLTSKTLLTALTGTRIYPDIAPQVPGVRYVVYYQDGNDQSYSLRQADSLCTDSFVFLIFAESNSKRLAIKEAFRNICDGKLTFLQSDGTTSIDFRSIKTMAFVDSYDSSPTAKEIGMFVCQFSMEVAYFISVPTLP